MKNYIQLILVGVVVFTTILGKAQSLSPEVISAAGGSNQIKGILIDWTMGELAVSRWSTPSNGSVTEGFHQPRLQVYKVGTTSSASISIAPNPVQSVLHLNVLSKEKNGLSATLIDVQGRILQQLTTLEVGQFEVKMMNYPAGVYFLSLRYNDEAPFQTFKVVKTQ